MKTSNVLFSAHYQISVGPMVLTFLKKITDYDIRLYKQDAERRASKRPGIRTAPPVKKKLSRRSCYDF